MALTGYRYPETSNPFRFNNDVCAKVQDAVITDITAAAQQYGAAITRPFVRDNCSSTEIKICGAFASADEGRKLQDYVEGRLYDWIEVAFGKECTEYTQGYTVTAVVQDVSPYPQNCLHARAYKCCELPKKYNP